MKTQAKQFIILTMDMHPLRLVFVFLCTLIYPALFHTSFFNFLLVSFSAQGYTKRNMPSWTSSWHTVIKKTDTLCKALTSLSDELFYILYKQRRQRRQSKSR